MNVRNTKNWLFSRYLSICWAALTVSSCTPFSNDMSKDVTSGTESAYDSSASPGTIGKHLLASKYFPKMTVEILPVVGEQPYQQSLNFLQVFLAKYLDKPSGIQIVIDPAIPAPTHALGQSGYTIEDIKKIETANRKHYSTKGSLAVFVLYADWESNDDLNGNKLLGEAYLSSSIVIFKNTMQTMSAASTAATAANPTYPYVLEATVLEHEFGHLMGLVNETGQGASHEDPNSPRHCTAEGCLMQASVESTGVTGRKAPPELDPECQNELKAIAAKQ